MLTLYSGTPGTGKSLHIAQDIYDWLRWGVPVVANLKINLSAVRGWNKKKKLGKFFYYDFSELNPLKLVEMSVENGWIGKEGKCKVIIDECPEIFDPLNFADKSQRNWEKFFRLHRKLGYDVYIISQNDRLINRKIRAHIEQEINHRKANNFGAIGMLITMLSGGLIKLFFAITYFYGKKEKLSVSTFIYKTKFGKIYDTFSTAINIAEILADFGGDTAEQRGLPPKSDKILKEEIVRKFYIKRLVNVLQKRVEEGSFEDVC